jgi:hypothetical protein
MDDLEKALPVEVTGLAARSGNELVFPLSLATAAVRIASRNLIAVLGVEAFRVMETGLHSETYSGYEFKLDRDWRSYVRLNNDAALRFIEHNSFGDGYGYVLTTVSDRELRDLRSRT